MEPLDDVKQQEAELDEIYHRLRDPDTGLRTTKKAKGLRVHSMKYCFQGSDLVGWLVQNMGVHKFVAGQIGQSLLDRLYMHTVKEYEHDEEAAFTPETWLRFQADDDPFILNSKRVFSGYIRNQYDILRDMERSIQKIYEIYIKSEKKEEVDYKAMKNSPEYKNFGNSCVELQIIQPAFMKEGEREVVTFFTNIYNLLVFHINVEIKHPKNKLSVFQRARNGSKYGYLIGNHKYSLSEIENAILRGNKKVFSRSNDPRREYCAFAVDPRIHFCLTNSLDPTLFNVERPIHIFEHKTFVHEMQRQTERFCNSNEIGINQQGLLVTISWIFLAYRLDFGKDRVEMLQWIASFLKDDQKKKDLLLMCAEPATKIEYREVEATPEEIPAEEAPLPNEVPLILDQEEGKPISARGTISGYYRVRSESVFRSLHQNYGAEMERANSYSDSSDSEKAPPIARSNSDSSKWNEEVSQGSWHSARPKSTIRSFIMESPLKYERQASDASDDSGQEEDKGPKKKKFSSVFATLRASADKNKTDKESTEQPKKQLGRPPSKTLISLPKR